MTFKSAIIGTATAVSIAAASIAAPTTASASPFAAMKTAEIQTGSAGIEQVKSGRHRGRHHNHGVNPGTAAAIGVGALILGAAIAGGAAYSEPRCRVVRVERWSPRYQAYVISQERVCN